MWFNKEDKKQPTAGERAEQCAETYLHQQGLTTCAKNYRCKLGEIDLIMLHGDTLVFVEVRLRTNRHFLSAAESVTLTKQQKIIRTAQRFLQERHLLDKQACRFDVIALNSSDSNSIEWIRNAFGV
jgi:putative endonuclease